MGFAIPLRRIGTYALDELERGIAVALALNPGAPDGDEPPYGQRCRSKLQAAEISVAYATADGSEASPDVYVVSEMPLPAPQLRALLEPLDTPVLVALADIEHAPQASRGRLVLRIVF